MSELLHAFVATPAYDGKVDCDYSQSLAEACQAATVFGIRVTACVMGNGAFIDLARNIFVKMFLDHNKEHPDDKYTHLFFIDSDLKFSSSGFVNLISAKRPVVAGAYRRRQEPEDYPVKWTPHAESTEKNGADSLWVEDDHWVQCSRVPTGFLCIERSVVEEMAAKAVQMEIFGQKGAVPQLFYTKLTDENRFQGEDFCWCDDYVEQYGKQIEVLADLDFVHSGYKCNWYKYLSKSIEDYKQNDAVNNNESRKLGDRRKGAK